MASDPLQPLKLAPAPNLKASSILSPTDNSPKKKASVACSACRRRKSRCTDGIPCQACKAHGTECIKDETEDMRRRLAVKKRLDSADVDRKLLDSLLDLLRFGYNDQINSLVNLVRSNAPRPDIQAFLDDGLNLGSPTSAATDSTDTNPPLPLQHRRQRRRHRTGNIADVMNPPIQVPAKPWTNVTDDDDFVSHLISLWFTWAHQWWHWVDKVLFIEAMKSRDLNNPLCAPYLVNMILADACLLDTVDEDEDEPHPYLREQFYAEAKTGLDAEEGRISLTLVQAVGVQWTYLDMNGQDKIGLLVLSEQVFMSKELDKYQEKMSKNPKISSETLSKIDQATSRLEWALFTLNAFTLVGSRRAHAVGPPQRPHPHAGHDENTESKTWMPYPRQAPHVEFHEGCHFACVSSLAHEAHKNEVSFIEAEGNAGKSPPNLDGLKQELRDWAANAPSCMQLHENATPHVITLHAMHSWLMLILAKQAAAAAAPSTKPIATFTPESPAAPYWRQVATSAAVTIGRLMELLITKWGVENFPVILLHPISIALFCLFEDFEHDDRRKAFISMCIALRAASRRFRAGKGILKLVKDVAEEKNIRLPKETEPLFRFERRSISASTGSEQWDENRVVGVGMNYLLEKWDDLKLDEY